LGEIEHLPVLDASVDVILSNCVINLSPDKAAVFREAFRALKPGGGLAISDVVATRAMPRELAESVQALTGCVAGSASIDELRALLEQAGFEGVKIEPRPESRAIIGQCMPGSEDYVASATVEAKKPGCPATFSLPRGDHVDGARGPHAERGRRDAGHFRPCHEVSHPTRVAKRSATCSASAVRFPSIAADA
jgi:SAM-dependent methyltransferase